MLYVWARQALGAAAVYPTCCVAQHQALCRSRQCVVSLQHNARRPSVPAKLLQSIRCQRLKWSFFPQGSDRGHASHSWFSKAPEVQGWLASSTSEIHWNQQVYSMAKRHSGFIGDKQMLLFLPFPPQSGPYKARFLMSTKTMPKHPMFSLPDH